MSNVEPNDSSGDRQLAGSCSAKLLTRRGFVVLAAAASIGTALSGCSTNNVQDEHTQRGYAGDTEVKDYPVNLKVYVDSNIQYLPGGSAAVTALGLTGLNHIEEYAARYQSQNLRSQVTFDFVYVDPADLLEVTCSGFADGDGLLALTDTVSAGGTAGTVECGEGDYMVRSMSYNFPDDCVIVRAAGSGAMLPDAPTIDGNDTSDGTINRLQQLPSYDGVVAVVDPNVATEGIYANRMLARQGFYSDSDGKSGFYDESVASKLRMYPTQDDAMAAVVNGRCSLGFALEKALNTRFTTVEQCYKPSGSSVAYSAAALSCSAEPSVMRDFFEFILICTD